ncbi:2-acylglycerol O-acyltransferase 1-like [Prorops nasuta]|uniref:2-acylglycerol O-acyltransferase 1-like n=1 Tax=Prorops nasuta TaxID=863751 RepID=UPI0034CE95CA
MLNVKFAPLNVPLERRLQTLAAAGWIVVCVLGSPICYLITAYLLLFTTTIRYFVILYLFWAYYDRDTCDHGGRSERYTKWFRNCAWWKLFRAYFPIKLVKTVDLEPTKQYLFCSFPHGVLSAGAFCSFATDVAGFKTLFPGLESRVVTLDQHFKTPLFREFAHSFGSVSANAKSLHYLLSNKPKEAYTGRAAVLIVGGASESLESFPGTYRIILKKRKGFIRIALNHGTPLVPVFSFGETDLYNQAHAPKGSRLRKIQEIFRRVTGIAPVLLIGRGFFQYTFGVVPHRKPINVVVGSPLELPKIKDPSKAEIEKYHEKFTNHLLEFFESNKHKYLEDAENIHIELIS